MDQEGFLNKQVSEIVGISPRQVLAWTEKGLVVPFKESTGVGKKRIYNYTNLLEFGLSNTLLLIGIGFRAVKKISKELRRRGLIENWVEEPVGILVYFFSAEEGESVDIIPWGMESGINLNTINEALAQSVGCILIDLSKIKRMIDRKL